MLITLWIGSAFVEGVRLEMPGVQDSVGTGAHRGIGEFGLRRIPHFCYKSSMGTATAETPPLHVLVVDDEANIRKTLSVCLETEGHKVVSVGNFQDAVSESSR